LEDVADELQNEIQQLVVDPQQLELVNQKLQSIYQLQKKHNVSTIEELLLIQNELSQKVAGLEFIDEEIQTIEHLIKKAEENLNEQAAKLHAKRLNVVQKLSDEISKLVKPLGMPNAQFDIQLQLKDAFLSNGKDEVSWLFSANKGMQSGLLKKNALGCELSLFMLAVKTILDAKSNLAQSIFDEIDTRVSVDVADKMGSIIKEMRSYLFVFSLSHLPLFASKGSQHFRVTKYDS